jgi:hypothetical protein
MDFFYPFFILIFLSTIFSVPSFGYFLVISSFFLPFFYSCHFNPSFSRSTFLFSFSVKFFFISPLLVPQELGLGHDILKDNL